LEQQTDSELMSLIQAGDAAQLAHLFERHHVALFRYLYQLTRNRALSEDLTQDVFLRVLKYAASYTPGYGFRAWLYGMARNASYDARRKVRGEVADLPINEFRSPLPAAEERLAQQQNNEMLQAALNRLPDDKRELLELSRFQEMRYDEIAAILQCEVGTVKVRVFRALKELRERFFEVSGRQIA
jgi:RNA polymerase sigma-70 factor (ECF subfamily)